MLPHHPQPRRGCRSGQQRPSAPRLDVMSNALVPSEVQFSSHIPKKLGLDFVRGYRRQSRPWTTRTLMTLM